MGKLTTRPGRVRLIHILLILLAPILISCQQDRTVKIPPKAVKGVLDLTDWDFDTDSPISLSGEWEFYWSQHLHTDQFSLPRSPEKSDYISVPAWWNGKKLNGEALPGNGYATFRLNVVGKDPGVRLAFDFLDISSAFRIYVNGDNIDSVGVAGKSSETTYPGFHSGISEFVSGNKTTEIIFHVSNFHHRLGGLWESIRWGPKITFENWGREVLPSIYSCAGVSSSSGFTISVYFSSGEKTVPPFISVFSVF